MRRVVVVLACAALCAVGVAVGPASAAPPAPPSLSVIRAELADLAIAAPRGMEGYSRKAFHIWSHQADGCTTRQDVLSRDGSDVVEGEDGCQPVSGRWHSAYDDTTVTEVSAATIDHLVPLAEAWRSGADRWSRSQREAFGNDVRDPQLWIASESSNSAKGDAAPDQWRPQNHSIWCLYAEDWIRVKYVWRLTATRPEENALADMLNTCV